MLSNDNAWVAMPSNSDKRQGFTFRVERQGNEAGFDELTAQISISHILEPLITEGYFSYEIHVKGLKVYPHDIVRFKSQDKKQFNDIHDFKTFAVSECEKIISNHLNRLALLKEQLFKGAQGELP